MLVYPILYPAQTFQAWVHPNPSISLYNRMLTKQTLFHTSFTELASLCLKQLMLDSWFVFQRYVSDFQRIYVLVVYYNECLEIALDSHDF